MLWKTPEKYERFAIGFMITSLDRSDLCESELIHTVLRFEYLNQIRHATADVSSMTGASGLFV
jgi:hypothetical protein